MDLWKAAAQPVWAKWAKTVGGDAQAVLDKAVELTKKYGAMAPTEVTTTTAPAGTTGIFFEDLGGKKVLVTIVPDPGKKFEVSTEGPFGAKIEGFDASGKSLGALEILDAAKGVLDYSAVAGLAKIVVTDARAWRRQVRVPHSVSRPDDDRPWSRRPGPVTPTGGNQ